MLLAVAVLICTTGIPACIIDSGIAADAGCDNIQLLYFHRTERCQSCNNAEQYARETLDRHFADEVKSGKVSLQSIDYQKDTAMADKYGVNMQGLKMVTTRGGEETVKDVPEVWALVRDKEACINCLKGALDKELGK